MAMISFGCTAGTDFAYVHINIDGSTYTDATSGDGPRGYYTAQLLAAPVVAGGSHTVKLQGYNGTAGTSLQVISARTFVFQLGA
jgi:hypothetical protein